MFAELHMIAQALSPILHVHHNAGKSMSQGLQLYVSVFSDCQDLPYSGLESHNQAQCIAISSVPP